MSGTVRFGPAAAVAVLLLAPSSGLAQQSYATGQTIAPAYEGWERNDDGSFTLVFGYMNRNWDEVIDVPVGPANHIEPGGARIRVSRRTSTRGATDSSFASGSRRTSATRS